MHYQTGNRKSGEEQEGKQRKNADYYDNVEDVHTIKKQ